MKEKGENQIIIYVVALDRNGVIGADGGIPWRLPADMRFFKKVTIGKPVIMGRTTYESIGRPLPQRHNIVMTRQPDYRSKGVTIVHSVAQALEAAGNAAEVAVIGGEEIYRQFMPLVSTLYLTHVDAEVKGDSYFPAFDLEQWDAHELTTHQADAENEFSFRIVKYERHKLNQ